MMSLFCANCGKFHFLIPFSAQEHRYLPQSCWSRTIRL